MTTSSKGRGSTRRPTTEPTTDSTDLPGFLETPEPTGPDPLDPTATTITATTEGASLEGDAGDGGGDVEAPTQSTRGAAGPSSRASTDAPPVDLPGLDEIARMVVGLASQLVRRVRTRAGRRPLPEGAWIADGDDQAAIGDPLARIAERHLPEGGNAPADVVDGIALGVGTLVYVEKGLAAEVEPIDPPAPADVEGAR